MGLTIGAKAAAYCSANAQGKIACFTSDSGEPAIVNTIGANPLNTIVAMRKPSTRQPRCSTQNIQKDEKPTALSADSRRQAFWFRSPARYVPPPRMNLMLTTTITASPNRFAGYVPVAIMRSIDKPH